MSEKAFSATPLLMKQVSLAVIAHDVEKGGAVGSVAWNHIKVLAKHFDVYVISQGIPQTQNANIHPVLIRPRKWNWLRRFCHVPNELSFQKAARKALAELSQNVDTDAVWCHSHGSVTLTAAPLARKSNFSVIMTTHGDIFERPAGTYDFFLTQYYKWVTKKAYSVAHRVHVLSPYMRDLAQRNGANMENIGIVPNGVYPEEIGLPQVLFRQKPMFTESEDLRVLFVGNLLPIKGLRHLLKALKIAQDKGCNNIFLQCVGDGPEMPSLKSQAKELGVDQRVTFSGRIEKQSLSSFFGSADVLCVPSDSDPLPTVVLEAFAAGLPVIGAATGGIPFMVGEKRGFLFEPGNSSELAEILLELTGDKTVLFEQSQECSKTATGKFCWDSIGVRLVEMLSECITENGETERKIARSADR